MAANYGGVAAKKDNPYSQYMGGVHTGEIPQGYGSTQGSATSGQGGPSASLAQTGGSLGQYIPAAMASLPGQDDLAAGNQGSEGSINILGLRDLLNKSNTALGNGVDWAFDNTVGNVAGFFGGQGAEDAVRNFASGQDLAPWISMAEDLGLYMIPGAGIPLAVAKNAVENSDDLMRAYTGTDEAGNKLSDEQRAQNAGMYGLGLALSAIPGVGKVAQRGMAKSIARGKGLGEEATEAEFKTQMGGKSGEALAGKYTGDSKVIKQALKFLGRSEDDMGNRIGKNIRNNNKDVVEKELEDGSKELVEKGTKEGGEGVIKSARKEASDMLTALKNENSITNNDVKSALKNIMYAASNGAKASTPLKRVVGSMALSYPAMLGEMAAETGEDPVTTMFDYINYLGSGNASGAEVRDFLAMLAMPAFGGRKLTNRALPNLRGATMVGPNRVRSGIPYAALMGQQSMQNADWLEDDLRALLEEEE